jgi:apolipoprotein N-acyltransferase
MPGTISDVPQATDSVRSADRPTLPKSWLWLGVGSVLLLFSYGANNVALAAWLAPIFLLRFVRVHRWRIWVPVLYVVGVAATAFQLRGMVPISGSDYYIYLLISSVPPLIPFAVDRLLARRLGGVAATLVFPCAWTVLEYLSSFGSFGSWGATAYSQYGNLPLLQILSVTGLWSITFLINWVAAVSNYLWDEGWNCKRARVAACICAVTIAVVILLGGLRMTLFPPSSETVRIASLSKRNVGIEPGNDVWDRLFGKQASARDLATIRNWTAAVNHDLLVRAEREAQAGARIVFWAEGNAEVLKEDEAEFLTRGSEVASKYHIYLGMALAALDPGQAKSLENKLVLVQPDGQIAWQYYKAHPVPGDEAAMSVTKDGRLLSQDTPFGRLSSAICFDADFPQLLAQAGTLRSDIVLSPSNDWRAIDPWHTQMASFRAIEQGFNLDRQTSHGLSSAFDYQGRVLAAMDHFHSSDYDMVADLPTNGVRTIYSRLGDWFAWLNLAAFVVLIVAAFRNPRRSSAG